MGKHLGFRQYWGCSDGYSPRYTSPRSGRGDGRMGHTDNRRVDSRVEHMGSHRLEAIACIGEWRFGVFFWIQARTLMAVTDINA